MLMSSLTLKTIAASAMLVAASRSAHADIGCPASYQGRSLSRNDGASLYQGDPANNVLLAPDRQAQDMRGSNVWLVRDPAQVTLVCRYDGASAPIVTRLAKPLSQCTQNLSVGSFSCY